MASETMPLECPSCKLVLQIDVAFAGGVCRCSNCGTLMTVPRDPGREKAERLMRPDAPPGAALPQAATRPDAPASRPDTPPGSRPASPGGSAGLPSPSRRPAAPPPAAHTSSSRTPAAAAVDTVDTATAAAVAKRQAPAAAATVAAAEQEVEEGVYVTESGKQVRITSQMRIPTAVKRKAVRIGIVAGFVMVMLTMTAVVFGAIFMMNQGKGNKGPSAAQIAAEVQRARGGYDPQVNPFLLETPNVLGLPVNLQGTAVVLDTSVAGRLWLGNAADAVMQGLTADRYENTPLAVQVFFARESNADVVPQTREPLNTQTRGQLKDALAAARPFGVARLAAAFSLAAQSKPAQIILVTGQAIDSSLPASFKAALAESSPQVQFDVVYLGQEPGTLGELTAAHRGSFVQLPASQLGDWFQQWLDQQQAAER